MTIKGDWIKLSTGEWIVVGNLIPIAGPPDIGSATADEWFVVPYNDSTPMTPELNCQQASSIKRHWNDYKDCIWHIPLGVIEAPAEELPKCPWCGDEMRVMADGPIGDETWFLSCPLCESRGPSFASESGAVEAARKAVL